MKLFAALERALLARWKKVKYALKVERWPLLNIKEQRLQLKKQYLESLFKKKWQKFERSIIRVTKVRVSPYGPCYNIASQSHCDSPDPWDSEQQGRSSYWTRRKTRQVRAAVHNHTQHGRNIRLMLCRVRLAICWRSSLKTVSSRIRLRLTIMWDSNGMSENAEISWQSQNNNAIIGT